MKKIFALLVFIALASPALADDTFAKREADRSGLTGTANMIGNTLSGFFSMLGAGMSRAGARTSDK